MYIKPIETIYNGYRFRSRQEARFAVMMDALGIDWDSEVQGYEVVLCDKTIYYLPDFELEATGAFIEIKGAEPTEDEFFKLSVLSQAFGQQAAVFWGSFEHIDFRRNNVLFHVSGLGVFKAERGAGLMALGPQSWDYDALDEALCHARQARFEHGETPQF